LRITSFKVPPMSATRTETQDFRVWLQAEFSEKSRKNPRFTLRAFARLLEMEPSSVSQILSGKRAVSTKVISRICDRLSARPEKKSQFLGSLQTAKSGPGKQKVPKFNRVTLDAFAVIADWHHYAI